LKSPVSTNNSSFKTTLFNGFINPPGILITICISNISSICLYVYDTGVPWTATYTQAKGDVIADLYNDMAAEQKARATYENLIMLTDDPLVKDTLRFLREREIVHFQRFGEGLRLAEEKMNEKKYF